MAQIEEQQKAINNLKVNLMDELTDRGVLSSPECERIIETHKEVRQLCMLIHDRSLLNEDCTESL